MEEKRCSVCGETYKSGLDYCPFCLSEHIPIENRDDKYRCGHYNEANKNRRCLYEKKCFRKECEYKLKFNIISVAILLFVTFGLFIIVKDFIADKYEKYKQNEVKQEKINEKESQKTDEIRQTRLNEIVQLLNIAQKDGIIINISKFNVKNRICAYLIVDEYVWNQLPHETKQQLCTLVQEYNELSKIQLLAFKGYRTGKTIMPYAFSVHNF